MASAPSHAGVRLLDPHTINQIAAGEVVERPASVVKELVENALDAGARRITIELLQSGTELIRVTDDGTGMSRDDAIACLERHATSKIRTVEDLGRIGSLGFRGEALPSIASVSRFQLSSGQGDGSRTVLDVHGGRRAEPHHEAGPKGTTISVEDLFYNTPARLKFLKTMGTELAQISEIVGKYAISTPDVAFRLIHGEQTLLDSPGDGDALSAVAAVWGRDVARGIAEIDVFREGIRVRGYISAPHFTRPTRSQQWIFVNGRPVKNRGLYTAIDVAYRQITPERRFPVALLMIDLDPASVDMNVSPTKSECRFSQEGRVFDAVRQGIKGALMEHGMMPNMDGIIRANEAIAASNAQPRISDELVAWSTAIDPGFAVAHSDSHDDEPVIFRSFADRFLAGLRVIGQTADAFFIIAENDEGIMVIDQHVAHERVLFERIRNARGAGGVERQPLLTPMTLDLDRAQATIVNERLEEFLGMGFELEPFGDQAFIVRAAPAAMRGADPITVLKELIDEILDGAGPSGLSVREQIWVMCSCKMAIKAGDRLGMAEMEKLLIDLARTENPYLCPHGRPITISMGKSELMRRFKRA
ncbi:MAG: DNA mismatch repair endonuclease MutL [Chthonomonas sp.]|nr:DNA mismatch repair endonuclease MutL [Chthonomonas sp.]